MVSSSKTATYRIPGAHPGFKMSLREGAPLFHQPRDQKKRDWGRHWIRTESRGSVSNKNVSYLGTWREYIFFSLWVLSGSLLRHFSRFLWSFLLETFFLGCTSWSMESRETILLLHNLMKKVKTNVQILLTTSPIWRGERGLVVGPWTCNPEVPGSNPRPCH